MARRYIPALLAVAALGAALGCASAPNRMPMVKLEIPDTAIMRLEGGPVAVRGKRWATDGNWSRSPMANTLGVDEDETTEMLVEGLTEELRARGITVDAAADRVIEVQVVLVAIQPNPMPTCVIDFNRRLGSDSLKGLQSRSSKGHAVQVCFAALTRAVIDTLNDPLTRDYLKGH